MGMTKLSRLGSTTFRPSTALSTEMAGVITPSPYNSAVPNSPNSTNHLMRPMNTAPVAGDQRGERQDATLTLVVGPQHVAAGT